MNLKISLLKTVQLSILLFGLLFCHNLYGKNFDANNVKIFSNENVIEVQVQSRTVNSKKFGLSYDLVIGSDNSGNISSVKIKFSANTDQKKIEIFTQKYKEALIKLTKISGIDKGFLIYPSETCMMKCMGDNSCTDHPTNSGVALCSADCFEDCYL